MDSVLSAQIPSTHSKQNGVKTSKEHIQNEILKLLQKKPYTPTELATEFHFKDRSTFSKNYLYPLKVENKIEKIEGSNYYKIKKSKSTHSSIKQQLQSESAVFQTELFKNWKDRNHSKNEYSNQLRFARICLGFVNPKFKIHPDNINAENWKEVVKNIVSALLEVAVRTTSNGEPSWNSKQSVRHAIIYGLGIQISEDEGIELKISGEKQKPKNADLHITPEQIKQAKSILMKHYNIEDFVKFGVKTWTFVRPSTIYLIELKKMKFYDEVVEYVKDGDGKEITDSKVVEYAKFRKDLIFSYTRRVCYIQVHENKTDADFHKLIHDVDFVRELEKIYNVRMSQRKRYLFWENNDTEFTFDNYIDIVKSSVGRDNKFFKKILEMIGFQKEDFGLYFRANYGFRHFGIQMWLLATDYNYELVSIMSHEDVATLKKWYGERTEENFMLKMKGVQVA